MPIKPFILGTGLCMSVLLPLKTTANILESFRITMQNIEVRQCNESSIQFKTDSSSYMIKLEPNKSGTVVFSLSGIGYASTVKFSNLLFGVTITGYHDNTEVYPIFSVDDVNKDILVDGNRIIFPHIYGAIPVWFNEQVDSINLQFSNSLSADVAQYLGIQDLHIIPPMNIAANPEVIPCQDNMVMIAVDGSSSIDKREREMIGTQLLEFVRKSSFTQDSNQLCVVEFGSNVLSVVESPDKHILVDALQRYKRGKNHDAKFTTWTNWSAAFDAAIKRKPELFIFITDGWSNWTGKPSSFSAQYETLLAKCNQLKTNGTRLLFVTSGIDGQGNSKSILSAFLNGDRTHELHEDVLADDTDLSDVDLITLTSFGTMHALNFASVLSCPPPAYDPDDDFVVSLK